VPEGVGPFFVPVREHVEAPPSLLAWWVRHPRWGVRGSLAARLVCDGREIPQSSNSRPPAGAAWLRLRS